jgi:hypothetical protein
LLQFFAFTILYLLCVVAAHTLQPYVASLQQFNASALFLLFVVSYCMLPFFPFRLPGRRFLSFLLAGWCSPSLLLAAEWLLLAA